MTKFKGYLVNIAVSLIILVIFIFLFEVILSYLDIPHDYSTVHSFKTSYEVKHHGLKPNAYGQHITMEFDTVYYTNSLGLRDREFNNTKQRYRILMLGDSFTEGHGVNVEDSIPKQVEKMLLDRNYDVEVINAGISSYSPILEYIYLKTEGILLNPDMVILNLDVVDIHDDYNYEKIAIFDKAGEVIGVPGSAADTRTWRSNIGDECSRFKFNLCILLIRSMQKLQKPINWSEYAGDIAEDKFYTLRPDLGNESEMHFQRTFNYIKKIKELSDGNNISFILATYPYAYQVSNKEWMTGRAQSGLKEMPIKFPLLFFEKTKSFAKKNNIAYIDSYYKFNTSDVYPPRFYDYNIHMTKYGYRLVAGAIAEYLLSDKEFMHEANDVK